MVKNSNTMSEGILISEDATGVIGENLADLVSIRVDQEVEEDELAMRYGGSSTTQDCDGGDDSDSGIQIFRPDDSEIVARYAVDTLKREPDPDDEIILNHPDDDDVVKRYATYFLSQNNKEVGLDENPQAVPSSVINDDDTCKAPVATSAGPLLHSPPHNELVYPDDEDMSDLDPPVLENEAERSSNPTNDSCTDMSDLERIQPVSPSRLSVEADSESMDGFEDGAMADPECSSHKRSITFYNLCCNKEIFSSISIDSPVREALRGLNHRHSLMRSSNSEAFQTTGECGRYRKPRNRSRSKVASRSDSLVCVIHKLERIAQTMETRCIEARRSLRRSCSQANFTKTGAKLKADLTPLLNTSASLFRKL